MTPSSPSLAGPSTTLNDVADGNSMYVDIPRRESMPGITTSSLSAPHDPPPPSLSPAPSSRIDDGNPQMKHLHETDCNVMHSQGTLPVDDRHTIQHEPAGHIPNNPSTSPIVEDLATSGRLAPAKRRQATHQLNRSTSVPPQRHEPIPHDHRFSSVPPPTSDTADLPMVSPLPSTATLPKVPPLGPLNLGKLQWSSQDAPPARKSSDPQPLHNPKDEESSTSVKDPASPLLASQKSKGKQRAIDSDSDLSDDDDEGEDLTPMPVQLGAASTSSASHGVTGKRKQAPADSQISSDGASDSDSPAPTTSKRRNKSSSTKISATTTAPASRRSHARKSRAVIVSEGEDEEEDDMHSRAKATMPSTPSSQRQKGKAKAAASRAATPGRSNLKKKERDPKHVGPDTTGELK